MSCEPLSAPPLVGDPATDARYGEGRRVVRWIEAHCRYGQGDKFGQPVRLEPFQIGLILRLYETLDGRRRYSRALFELPKGNGKTPLAAWIAAYELVNRPSAVIPVAAASYDQADLIYGDLRSCVTESPSLSAVLDPLEAEVQVKNGPGRAFRVAAVAGTNDGLRPTAFLADEIHEWTGNKERVHLVIENGCSKRKDAFSLSITTPGWDRDSLAGRLHDYGLRVNSGEIDDERFLFVWYGCPPDRHDLNDPEQLRQAIRDANPAADAFADVEAIAARYHQIPAHEFARYHLASWAAGGSSWLTEAAWDALADPGRQVPDGAPIVIGFDGSFNADSTAAVGVLVAPVPHVFVVGSWQPANPDDEVDILDVEEALLAAGRRWKVLEVTADPYRWARSLAVLYDAGLCVSNFPQTASRMAPATARFSDLVATGNLTHSGDPRLRSHILNTVLVSDHRGSRITKDSKKSPRRIDLAVAALMAVDRFATSDEAAKELLRQQRKQARGI